MATGAIDVVFDVATLGWQDESFFVGFYLERECGVAFATFEINSFHENLLSARRVFQMFGGGSGESF